MAKLPISWLCLAIGSLLLHQSSAVRLNSAVSVSKASSEDDAEERDVANQSVAANLEANLCATHTLAISFSDVHSNLKFATIVDGSRTFAWYNWADRKLFTLIYPAEGRICHRTFTGKCALGGIEVAEVCTSTDDGSSVETDLGSGSFFCMSGMGCPWPMSELLKTSLASYPGGAIQIFLPARRLESGEYDTCVFTLNSGQVGYKVHARDGFCFNVRNSYSTHIALAPHVARVAEWAATAADEELCGPAAMSVHTRMDTSIEKNLVELSSSLSARYRDAGETQLQVEYGLWALYFEEQHAKIRNNRMHRLFSDIKKVESFRQKMSTDGVDDVPEEEENEDPEAIGADLYGITALYHHFRGLWRHRPGLPGAGKLRVVIYTCRFGSGHQSAAKAVQGYLGDGYDIKVIDTSTDNTEDVFFSKKKSGNAKQFNELIIKRNLYWVANRWKSVMDKIYNLEHEPCPPIICKQTFLKQQYRINLLDTQPHLIVTAFHMELMPIWELSVEFGNIPILHVATDMDIKMKEIFPANANQRPTDNLFAVGVPFDLDESWSTIAPLDRAQTFLSGYPVRTHFLVRYDAVSAANWKKDLVPEDDIKVLLVMGGGAGASTPWLYDLAHNGRIGMKLHIIIIAGSNQDIYGLVRNKLPNVKEGFPKGLQCGLYAREVRYGADEDVTIEVAQDISNPNRAENPYFVFPGTLSKLMDAADVALTKPGGGSTAEVIYRGVPALFDISRELFKWEYYTVQIFLAHDRGRTFTKQTSTEFLPALNEALRLERSQSLAITKDGNFLNPSILIPQMAQELIERRDKGVDRETWNSL